MYTDEEPQSEPKKEEVVAIRVGVNGFGRIGMLFTKAAMDRGDIEVVAANDLMPFESLANLFKHDSTHGVWQEDVSFKGNVLRVGEKEIIPFRFIDGIMGTCRRYTTHG